MITTGLCSLEARATAHTHTRTHTHTQKIVLVFKMAQVIISPLKALELDKMIDL